MSYKTYRFSCIVLIIITILGLALCFATSASAETTTDYPSFWYFDSTLVRNVQRALNDHGASVKVDGDFGPATATAVKSFQLTKGLKVSGVVDDDTADKLGLRNAEWPYGEGKTLYYMADFTKKAPKTGYVIYVALGGRSQTPHFALFKDGKLVAETPCITGHQNDGAFTPVGVHAVSKKSDTRTSSHGYYYYSQLWLKVNGKNTDYAIHSLLHKTNGQLVAGQTLGTQKSDGCIRLPDELAAWLRQNIKVGTTIIIDDRAYSPSSVGYDALINP
ncbi:murein L,D-transpeptidase [Candidatus Saccharibacteria bacterium]|nr:murein L,D-transpeptidase [Candidatus Saccharibacteria bacterium]